MLSRMIPYQTNPAPIQSLPPKDIQSCPPEDPLGRPSTTVHDGAPKIHACIGSRFARAGRIHGNL